MRLALLAALVLSAGCHCQQRSFNRLELPQAQEQPLNELRFLDDERLLARSNGGFRVWNVRTGAVELRYHAPQQSAGVSAVSFGLSADAALTAIDDGKTIRVVRTGTRAEVARFAAKERGTVLGVMDDGTTVTLDVAPGWDVKTSTLRVWRPGLEEPAWERALDGPRPFRVLDRELTRVAVMAQKSLTLLALSTGRELWSRPVTSGGDLTFSADGARLAMREGRRFLILDVERGAELGSIEPMTGTLMAFPGDLFFRQADGWVHRYDPSGSKRWSLPLRDARGTHRNLIASAVSPRGTRLVLFVDAVRTLDLHDAATGGRRRTLARRDDYNQRAVIDHLALSPDDSLVAVAENASLLVWEADGSRKFTALADPLLVAPATARR